MRNTWHWLPGSMGNVSDYLNWDMVKYKRINPSEIIIGNEIISFPNEIIIEKIETFNEVICFNTRISETGLNWDKIETHQIWKQRCLNNLSELYCYDLTGKFKWKLQYDNVVGFGKIIPELKIIKDFITPEHYNRYMEKFRGKELLEVYTDECRFVHDANTGAIYDKMESR